MRQPPAPLCLAWLWSPLQKRRMAGAVAFAPLCFLLFLTVVHGQNSATSIGFQGVLNGADGKLLANGSYTVVFRFYDSPTVAGWRYATTNESVALAGGVASTAITVDPSIFDGSTRYLGISVNGGQELAPRVLVMAVPYSLATRGIAVNPPSAYEPPISLPRPTKRVVIGSTTEDISRIPTASEALVIGTTNQAAGTTVGIYFDTVSRAGSAILVQKSNAGSNEDNTMHFYVGKEGESTSRKAMTINQNGNVAIGSNPFIYSRLVVGSSNGDADRIPPCHEAMVIGTKESAGAGTRAGLYFDTNERNGGGIIVEKVNDGSNEDHRMRFYVTREGEPQSQNYMTIYEHGVVEVPSLRIRGGSDLAEPFDVTAPSGSTSVVPGMVMVIDRDRDGKLTPCAQAYDTAVAGILSGAKGLQPGMVMKAEGQPHAEGESPLAMTGRVWCLADASHTPILRGDRLTTSPTVGHAMKATDLAQADGAVIGKAMTELKSGTGLVLVLVNLQ